METIIRKNEVLALLGNEITVETIAQSIEQNARERSYVMFNGTPESNGVDELNGFFADLYEGQEIYIHSKLVQTLSIEDEDGTEYNISINENYVDAGSVDYAYTYTISY